MARFFFSPPAPAAVPVPLLKPAVYTPVAAIATGAEIRRFLFVIQHGKLPSEPDISPQHTVRPQKKATSPQPKTEIPGFCLLPAGEKGEPIPTQPVFRRNPADKDTGTDRKIPGETEVIPADTVPYSNTEKITTHLQLRRNELITGISDTLLSRISHIAGKTGSLSTCRATFPVLGEVSFTVRHSADGVHIQIRCPSAGQALLLSCLPQLQDRLTQKTPQPVTISLTGHLSGSASAVRRK
ncbi:hypothetical protein [Morganella morganii]|uniref:hypothetical protein n=1 Tax=Morganella morganii TaxID=582 RepID=UPI001C4514D8|nr:hypothetical protein [Morganella morganii]QXO64464.1 hypothetical protein JC825_13880 [Morganella morganii]